MVGLERAPRKTEGDDGSCDGGEDGKGGRKGRQGGTTAEVVCGGTVVLREARGEHKDGGDSGGGEDEDWGELSDAVTF
ncbi:MAG TPA: hypothetical protein DDW30_02025 [Clostridiales bacterium]|nr:hypothetical protein [Clostridiales bacterium]